MCFHLRRASAWIRSYRLSSHGDRTAASLARPPVREGRELGHGREKPSDGRCLEAGEELRPYQKPGARQEVGHHWRRGTLSRRQVQHRPILPVCVAKQRGPARVIQASVTEIYGGRPLLSRASSSDILPRREVGFALGSRIVRMSGLTPGIRASLFNGPKGVRRCGRSGPDWHPLC
jgi:hypothetical protein